MRNKRSLVIGVALILLTLVAGTVFAATNLGGVWWGVIEGKSPRFGSDQSTDFYLDIYNENNYRVTVYYTRGRGGSDSMSLEAGEERHSAVFDKSARVTRVDGGGKIVRE
jgi:hypothetical protein